MIGSIRSPGKRNVKNKEGEKVSIFRTDRKFLVELLLRCEP